MGAKNLRDIDSHLNEHSCLSFEHNEYSCPAFPYSGPAFPYSGAAFPYSGAAFPYSGPRKSLFWVFVCLGMLENIPASASGNHGTPEATPAVRRSLKPTAASFAAERVGVLPTWIRPPKSNGQEYHTGLSRSKLYELAGRGKIRTASAREPGQVKGTRFFHLQSILDYIASCEITTPATQEGAHE